MKKALLLCTSHNDLGLIRALRKLGFYIIATGNLPGQPGERYVDKYIQEDYSDKDRILSIAENEKVDVICQCCNDFGVYTAAYVAEKMGLPGYDSYDTVLTLHNKDQFKMFAQKYSLMTPEAVSFDTMENAMAWIERADYPLIVKPTDASAGNGISKVTTINEAYDAINNAFSKSRIGRVVLEPFIEGTQHGFCTFLRNEKVIAVCSNNEYSMINPYRVEIDTFPADNYMMVEGVLIEQIEKIAKILHLKDGIFHLQYILDGEGNPKILEVMRRVLGNMYSVPGNMLTGIDWDYWETRARCGLSCEKFPVSSVKQEGFYAYKTLLAKRNGVITEIKTDDKFNKYIIERFLLKKVGEKIENYKSEPVGFIFMMFSSSDEMKDLLINHYDNTMVLVK